MEATGRGRGTVAKTIVLDVMIMMVEYYVAHAYCPSLQPSSFFSTLNSDITFDLPIIVCYEECDVKCMRKIEHRDLEEYMECASGCMKRCKGRFERLHTNTCSVICGK